MNDSKIIFLRHLAERAIESTSDQEFFHIAVKGLLPMLRNSKHFLSISLEAIRNKDTFLDERSDLAKNINSEIEQTLLSIKSILHAENLLNNPAVFQQINSIETVLQQKKISCSWIDRAATQIESLLVTILALDNKSIVEQYAKVEISNIPMVNICSGKWDSIFISEYTFAPSLRKKRKLDQLFHQDKIEHIWIALELLYLAEWCLNNPKDFFERAIPPCPSFSPDERNVQSTLYSFWTELNMLKDEPYTQTKRPHFFGRKKFTSVLNLLIDKIVLLDNNSKEVVPANNMANHILGIELGTRDQKTCLLLKAYNSNNFTEKFYVIHNFSHADSGVLAITKRLLDPSEKDWINVIDASKTSGIKDSHKYIERINLNTHLASAFFECKSILIRLKKQSILCKTLSSDTLLQIENYIQSLKPLENYNPLLLFA